MAISTLDGDPYSIMLSCPKDWVIASGKASQITQTHSPPPKVVKERTQANTPPEAYHSMVPETPTYALSLWHKKQHKLVTFKTGPILQLRISRLVARSCMMLLSELAS